MWGLGSLYEGSGGSWRVWGRSMGPPGDLWGLGFLWGVPAGVWGPCVGPWWGLWGVSGPCAMPPGVPGLSGVPVWGPCGVWEPCAGFLCGAPEGSGVSVWDHWGSLWGLGSLCGTIGVSMGSGSIPRSPLGACCCLAPGALPGGAGSPNTRALKALVQVARCLVSVGLLPAACCFFSAPGIIWGGRGLPEPAPRSPVALRSSGCGRGEV